MEYDEILIEIQGILVSLTKRVGLEDFKKIRHGSNHGIEISDIINLLKEFFVHKSYIQDGKINEKFDSQLRKIMIFLILNTDLTEKLLTVNKTVAHLIETTPQLSPYLLLKISLSLKLKRYYAEAIANFPLNLSLELIENCVICFKRLNTDEILEQIPPIVVAIYTKLYHLRYEKSTTNDQIKLLDPFIKILQNFDLIKKNETFMLPKKKLPYYLGRYLYEVFNLMKSCLSIYFASDYKASQYDFYQFGDNKRLQSLQLSQSEQLLKEFNKQMFRICEKIIENVSITVFCYWTEYEYNGLTMQCAIGYLCHELLPMVEKIEDNECIKSMLSPFVREPKPVEDLMKELSEEELLKKVLTEGPHQALWYQKFIRTDFLQSKESYNVFKKLLHLSSNDDFVHLLMLGLNNQTEFDLKETLLQRLQQLTEQNSIYIVSTYFSKTSLNKAYESIKFDEQLTEFFNKLTSNCEINFSIVACLILQNPIKFLNFLLDESVKTIDNTRNIIKVLIYAKPICNLPNDNNTDTIFNEIFLNNLKNSKCDPNEETCLSYLLDNLVQNNLLNYIIFDELSEIIIQMISVKNYKDAAFFCHLFKNISPIKTINYQEILPKLTPFLNQLRWNFFTYEDDKMYLLCELLEVLVYLMSNAFKFNCLPIDDLPVILNPIKNKMNLYHLESIISSTPINFMNFVSVENDSKINFNAKVCWLLKLLPSSTPKEWKLIYDCLIVDDTPIKVVELFNDVLLILSQMTNTRKSNMDSLSYCLKQFCIIAKMVVDSKKENDIELEKSFIKNVCCLIKNLPEELHNTSEIFLVNLFNFEVMKTLKDDDEFKETLDAISHLNVGKIIYSKIS